MPRQEKPFELPFQLIEHGERYMVANASGYPLAYVYHEDEPGRGIVTRRLTREDARKLATQIARLPELLDELRRLRAARDEPA
jgi:hypothetical protein